MNPEPYRGRPTNSHKRKPAKSSGDKGCCPMAAAIRSVKRGKFRLAGRYARWSLRLLTGTAA